MTCLRMPILTTERTTAFIPALSPPDVRTAIFMDGDCAIMMVNVRKGEDSAALVALRDRIAS